MFKPFLRTIAMVTPLVLGAFFPECNSWTWLIKWCLIVMVFITFLGIRWKEFTLRAANIYIVLVNLAVALIAWLVCRQWGGMELSEAAFFVGIMPTATSSPVIISLMGGNVAFMLVSLLLGSAVICAVLPFLMPIVIGQSAGWEISWQMAQNIFLVMGLPFIVAWLVRRIHPQSIAWPAKLKDFSFGLWVFALFIISAHAFHDIQQQSNQGDAIIWQIGIVSLLLCIVNFWLGRFLTRGNLKHECSQALGQKNTTFCMYLALVYASPLAALGPTFYVFWQNLWNAWQLYRHSSKQSKRNT